MYFEGNKALWFEGETKYFERKTNNFEVKSK